MSGKMSVDKIKKKLEETPTYFKENKMVEVLDDWFPCFPDNKISVTIMFYKPLPHSAPIVKMTAWGMDDTGYEIEYQCGNKDFSYSSCYSIYKYWKDNVFDKIDDGVDQQWFIDHCFYPA